MSQAPPDVPSVLGLKPVPMDRSYGMTLHVPITDEAELLANSEIPVYRDLDHAKKSLLRGTRPPLGTSRIFNLADLPSSVRYRLPPEFRYRNHEDAIVVLDKPVITDAGDPESIVETLRKYGPLPVFSHNVQSQLLKHPLLSETSSSPMWGLPGVRLQRLRADGKPVRKPGDTLRRKDNDFLYDHLGETADSYFLTSYWQLMSPFSKITGRIKSASGAYFNRSVQIWFSYIPNLYIHPHTSRQSELKTIHGRIRQAAHAARLTANFLEVLIDWNSPRPHNRGVLRSPIIFLRAHGREQVRNFLYSFHPHLELLKNYPFIPSARLGISKSHLEGYHKEWTFFRRQLYRLCSVMGYRAYPVPPPRWTPSFQETSQ